MKTDIQKPDIIAFEVTRRCRFHCKHCRAAAGDEQLSGEHVEPQHKEELTTSQCRKILVSIARFNKKCTIILTGGEPMERQDIYEIIRCGKELGLTMVMATCGYLIDQQSIKQLKKAGIKALSFSLDGASAATNDEFRLSPGAFDETVKATQIARQAKMRFQINTTISKINVNEIYAISQLAQELGACCFNPFILVPTGRGSEIADQILDSVEYETLLNRLLDIKHKLDIDMRVTCGPQFARVSRQKKLDQLSAPVKGCLGGRAFGFISYKADVQICGFLDISAGNLVKNSYDFEDIWVNSDLLKKIRDLPGYKGSCGNCEYLGVCGGCRARAFTLTGDYLAADLVCDYKPKKNS